MTRMGYLSLDLAEVAYSDHARYVGPGDLFRTSHLKCSRLTCIHFCLFIRTVNRR